MDPFQHPSATAPRRNLAEEITARLRDAIVSGEIKPGTALAEPVLAEQFGASRAPIREALIALERDGLVEFNERSRTRVRMLAAEDYQEIISMRAALEGLAASLAAARWTEADTRFIEGCIRRQEKAETLGELSHLDVEMHAHIVQLSRNGRLIHAWRGIRWQFEMYLASMHRHMEQRAIGPRRITVAAHRELLAALSSGRAKFAGQVMSAHIEGSTVFTPECVQAGPPAPMKKGRGAADAGLVLIAVAALLGGLPAMAADADAAAQLAFFESKVRPLLVERCYECHSGTKTKGGLSLDTQAGWMQGGESGPAIVPGDAEGSRVIQAVRRTHEDTAMPPEGKGAGLTSEEVRTLETWVRNGAHDPRESTGKIAGMDAQEARSWWAFQPLPAAGRNHHLTSAEVDGFVNAKIQAAGLKPADKADKRTLIRRAAFDLTGLPPTGAEVEAFLADASPDAFSRLVERLLGSPHYGEKWGRHWLDVVRYADSLDSRGSGKEGDILDAWRYRDWVVDAFNQDLPYDEFVSRQIAGDILAREEWDASKVAATGMYAIGQWGNGDADKEKLHTDIVDDQIDVTGRAFLGLTLACARCHDHKFDPITTKDYYGLAGIFFSSRILDRFASKTAGEKLMRIPLLPPAVLAQREVWQKRLAEVEARLGGQSFALDVLARDVAGRPGLYSRHGAGAANPSLTVNTTTAQVEFSTITLPPRSVAVHPGTKQPVSLVWRSPVAGTVQISLRLEDADARCGDGIVWALRRDHQELRSGVLDNGAAAEVPAFSTVLAPGRLIQLVIRPRREYTCDTTRVELTVSHSRGTTWSLAEALLADPVKPDPAPWAVVGGEVAGAAADPRLVAGLQKEKQLLERRLAVAEYAQGLREGGIPQTRYEGLNDAPMHRRGRYDQLGEVVPRAMPAVLTPVQPRIAAGSGRLELARWIADARNPLTARVMVNRLWQHHFGVGIVASVNNFGKLGAAPTHPELLEALAAEFIRGGWSVKHLHRLIMGSAAYQRSAAAVPETRRLDADNHLLSHQRRRRLTAEEMRDAMLHAAGRLDPALGGLSVPDISSHRRTLYLRTIRSDRTSYQALFDGADPTAIVEQRVEATVAPQALFLVNHPFTLQQAEALAARLLAEVPVMDDSTRMHWLCRRLFHRPADPAETALAAQVTGPEEPARWQAICQMLLCSNEFAYVD